MTGDLRFEYITIKVIIDAPENSRAVLVYLKEIHIKILILFFVVSAGTADSAVAQQEGHPDQVWSIDFEGNETYSGLVLSEIIATRPFGFLDKLRFWKRTGHELNDLELKKDAVRIRRYYQRRGFEHVDVTYDVEEAGKSWKKKIVFNIAEREPIVIRNLDIEIEADPEEQQQIENSADFERALRQHEYKTGSRYQRILETETAGLFTDALKELGYPYAEVDIEADVDTLANTADITIRNRPGPRARISNIEVIGSTSLPADYIVRESGLQEGQQYSAEDFQEGQKEIFNHHLFRFADFNLPDQPQDSTLDLEIRVRENSLRSVQALVGFGTEENLRGQLGWTHRNAFGKGHRFSASGNASFIEQSLYLDYLFPYVFNTKSSVVISPFAQHLLEPNYELFRGGIRNSYIYRYTDQLTGTASYEFTDNLELSQASDASMPDSTLGYRLSSLQANLYYRQENEREERGWVIIPAGEISGLMGEAGANFEKLVLDVRKFTPLSETTLLAKRVQAGGVFDVAEDSLPSNIRFYLGGTNSVRGWNRHDLGPKDVQYNTQGEFDRYVPAGGRAMFSFNLEIRQDLNRLINGFGIAFFMDGGQVWRRYRNIRNNTLQLGGGGGLRYQSPLGPIRVDVGYKLNPTPSDLDQFQGRDYGNNMSRIGIHFSIGQAF